MIPMIKSEPSPPNRNQEPGIRNQILTCSPFRAFRGSRIQNPRSTIINLQSSILLFLTLITLAQAAPLDDRITAFKAATTQNEAAVSEILQLGLTENRSALAFAAVKPWLADNAAESTRFLFLAAQSAEFAGEWRQALSLYRKLLKQGDLDAATAAVAAPNCYRLLINHLGDPDSAYLLMREEGLRLRAFGNNRQFDAWLFAKAAERKDLTSMAKWLAAIYQSDEPREAYEPVLTALLADLETYTYNQPQLLTELKALAAAKHTTPVNKARIEWVIEVVPFANKAAELLNTKRPVPDDLATAPLQAASKLIAVSPYEGSLNVARGWMHFSAGDSGFFSTFVTPRRAEKAAPILAALKTLPVEQAQAIINLQVPFAKSRNIVPYLVSDEESKALIAARPELKAPQQAKPAKNPKDPKVDPNAPSEAALAVSRELLELPANADPAAVEAAFKTVLDRAAKAPAAQTILGLDQVAKLPSWSALRQSVHSLFNEKAPVVTYPRKQGYEQLALRVITEATAENRTARLQTIAAGLWSAAAATDDPRSYAAADAYAKLAAKSLKDGNASLAMTMTRCGTQSIAARAATDAKLTEILANLRNTAGLAAAEVGAVEIPVDESNPAFPIYKSNAEFAAGNLDSAWQLYLAHTDQLAAVLRSLPVNYAFWLLEKSIETDRSDEAENLIKELTIWSRQAEGTFSPEQDAQLKIAYADLAFRKGALPTARAWYRKVAEAAEYEGTEVHLTAALGSVTVDRVSKNFGAAMTELDSLMKFPNENFRKRIRYARAEVLMDQESFAEALDEIEQVLRQEPKHPDALILRGKIHFEMRKLVEASEIELGPSQDKTIIVPGEAVKINLRDPTLNVSGIGADIEVEIWAKSGDRERVLLYQLGDSKEKFRADVPTALGPPTANDKVLQVLGDDEIRFGYSERFRAKMKDLPADPGIVIGVASDAFLSFSAGAFPPREGERRLDIEELGLSTSQAALGTRTVRPGNPVYVRVTDPDRSITTGDDEITVSLQTTSGDEIRQLALKETSPFSGEFQGIVPTSGAQAIAFASESAPGRDPNMAISSRDYPGWQGNVGDASKPRTFGIDLNDNAPIDKMTIDTGDASSTLKNFVLQTSLDGKNWTTRARFPEDTPVWDGQPHVSSFATFGTESVPVSKPEGRGLPADWAEIMDYTSNRASLKFLSAKVTSLSAGELPVVMPSHPGYGAVIRYRALFHQPAAAIRRFQLAGLPDDGNTIFLLNGTPAAEDAPNGLLTERELPPGLHEIQVWRHEGRGDFLKHKPVLLCDDAGKPDLIPCPDAMFDPATFPGDLKKTLPQPATLTPGANGSMEVAFGDQTRARLVRLVINGFEGVAPTIKKVTLSNRESKALLPVAQDFMELRGNTQLEVLPGDNIIVRYEDPRTASPKRNRLEQRLNVAFNDAIVSASFLTYIETEEGRELVLEPIRRFRYDDAVAIVIEDPDMDASPEKDIIDIKAVSTSGGNAVIKAVETEEHSGRFLGRIFPVTGEPERSSEIKVAEGGTLTATYLDSENLSPGIPTERNVIIEHARYIDPALSAYTVTTKPLPAPKISDTPKETTRTSAAEVVTPRRALIFDHADPTKSLAAVAGSSVRFDVVVPHLALAGSSTVNAYVQTEAGRKAKQATLKEPYDVAAPGTLKLTGVLTKPEVVTPDGYQLAQPPSAPGNEPPLEEGRFSFTIPLILGETPDRSFATKSAEDLPDSAIPDGLAVKVGDIVHVGYPYKDSADAVKWITAAFKVESHPFLDVMDSSYAEPLAKAFVGEKIHLRLIDRGLDRSAERDIASVSLKATSGATTTYELQETEGHSGIFKSAFAVSYAPDELPGKLPPVALNGFPVRYGDDIEISYSANDETQSLSVNVNKGANGFIEPFSKRFTGDEMAVRTSFTLAECYFELAKKHRELDQESLARREIAQARKLLAEAIATHRDDDLRAHAEYLLGNLAQEYADLAKNDEAKLPMYQDALARFSKIPSDYPETEFAPKAQFKTALVYEKMGETQNAVEEYVKLAYKYPNHELLPSVMSRLGGYFQQTGLAFKKEADSLREKEDEPSKAEVLRLDQLSYPEFRNAAMVFAKLQQRFPDDALAGLAGLRAGQNYMRAHQYSKAIRIFTDVHAVENYDDREIRSQALYWSGISNERMAGLMAEDNWRGRGEAMDAAYEIYRRVTFDFPDSLWAKYARGRLADPAFESRVAKENEARERMIESLKESRKSR
jgi:outer membrane protein assembly factor BamD (BamD/ComL family)